MLPNELFAARVVFLLIDVSLRAAVLVVMAGLFCYLLRRSSAATRCTAWALTLAALLCLPSLRVLMPVLPPLVLPLTVSRSTGWLKAQIAPSRESRSIAAPPSQLAKPAPKIPVRAAPITPAKNQDTPPVASRVLPPSQRG